MHFYKICQDYISYLGAKQMSPYTIRNYKHYLRRFYEFAEDLDPKDLNLFIIDKYRALLTAMNLDVRTQNYHLSSLKSLLKYCKTRDVINFDPDIIELAKEPDREVEYLTKEEFERLANAKLINSTVDLRDRTILETLFATGLRVRELTNLNKKDLDFETKQFSILGKGNRYRLIFLSERSIFWLKKYLEFRNDDESALFINYRNNSGKEKRLTTVSVEAILRTWVSKAGFNRKITPHTLRHSFATSLLQSGVDIRKIQIMMGHSSIMTTQIYLHCSDKTLKEAHSLCFN